MIQSVIFDLDGTLYDYDGCNRIAMEALREYCASHLKLDGEAFYNLHEKAYHETEERIGYTCASIHNRLLRCQYMLEEIGAPLFPHAMNMYHKYWDTMLNVMKPYPGLKSWMRELREHGIRIGICTNMTAYIQYEKIRRLGLSAWIDFVVTSEETGCEKPEKKLFEACRKKSGTKAENCLFVGDSLTHDVNGARAAGMQALLFDPEGKTKSSGSIHSYREHPAL